MNELEVPQDVQQLQQLAILLQKNKADSDSVTWVPELIPKFVQKVVETVCSQPGDQNDSTAAAHNSANRPEHSSTQLQLTSDIRTQTAPTAPAAALAVGTQHAQFTSSSKRPVHWVMTTCLVPDGLPTAAAAEDAGGLATLEVVCRLLMLQDCQPAAATPALEKALNKVKWQQYGLQYREYFSCDSNTGTGIITLGVLPDAVMVPLSLIVCSCNAIEASQGRADAYEPPAATHNHTDPTQPQDAPPKGSKRKRDGENRAATKPPTLSMRREVPLWVGAFQAALSDLKAQLPGGYMMGKHEALLAAALPPIALSVANIMARAANAHFKQESCRLLGCEPPELQGTLLTQLEDLAADALAYKTAAINQQQRKQAPQPVDTATAAAALLAEEHPDLDQDTGDGHQELLGDQHAQQTRRTQHRQMCQEQDQQTQQHWQVQHWPFMDVGPGGLLGTAQQQQHQGWIVAGGYGAADAPTGAWGAVPPFSNSRQEGTLGQVSIWEEDQQQQQQLAGDQGWLYAAGKRLWEGEQVCVGTGVTGYQQGAWDVQDGRTAWHQQSQQVQPFSQQQRQQDMRYQQQQCDTWGMLSRQYSAGPQQDWHPVDATVAVGLGLTQAVGDVSHGAERFGGIYGGNGRLQVTGGGFSGPAPRPATGAPPAIPRPSGMRRMSGSVAASLF